MDAQQEDGRAEPRCRQLYTPEFWQDPWPTLRQLRETEPVCPVVHPGGHRVWFVSCYEDGRTVLADPRLSKDMTVGGRLYPLRQVDPARRPATADTPAEAAPDAVDPETGGPSLHGHMLDSDPPAHTRRRGRLAGAFTARRVEALRPRISELVDQLLDAIEDAEGPVDLMSSVAFPVPFTVIGWLLDVPLDDHATLRGWTTSLLSGAGTPEVAAAERDMAHYLDRLIAEKRADPGDDLLSAMITDKGSRGTLDDAELVPMAYVLLVAGHETTVNLIGNGVAALLANPDQLDRLRADAALWPQAVDEVLRFDPPLAISTWRFTTEPVTVGATTIPEGEFVEVSLSSMGRDSARWDDPDCFDIDRSTTGHLAFGHGIHYCAGVPLARLEAELVLHALFDRFPEIRLAVDPASLQWRPSLLIRGLQELPVFLR